MKNLSGNAVSRVFILGDKVVKVQPKHLTDNEAYALEHLWHTGFVPRFQRTGVEEVTMELLIHEPITDAGLFIAECQRFVEVCKEYGLRHGDLTQPHVFPVGNSPRVIDWAESRVLYDPRPDKRPEGDKYWMDFTCGQILSIQPKGDSDMGVG